MKIEIDTHTHSIASLHAYSTIDELADGAKKNHLRGFVLTEHGPALQGFPHPYYFGNLRILPEKIHNVRLFYGAELNIMDSEGGVDLVPRYLRTLDFVMAGFHEACFPPANIEENTKALIAAISNPFVDGISHPGNPVFPVDLEEVVKAAVRCGKTLEINNSSFLVRRGSEPNCRRIVQLARQFGALLSCGSDAHYKGDVGNFKTALKILSEEGVHPDQIINSSYKRFIAFSEMRKTERLSVG